MKCVLIQTVTLVIFLSCTNATKNINTASAKKQPGTLQQFVIAEDNLTPTVDIKSFTLICDDSAAYINDAKEIMKVKRKWPLAMQSKKRASFEEILSREFSFRGEDEFFGNKESYIKDRETAKWDIDTVRYENMVLQLFDETAMLTYRNKLTATDSTGRRVLEYYTWADIFKKEEGRWKILASHTIDARVEYLNKQEKE